METVLLALSVSTRPALASELAALLKRPQSAVRASLARLHTAGFASREVVGKAGPLGSYAWRATPTGVQLVAPLVRAVQAGARL
jgi:predicted transcriptional regulator